MLGLVLGVVLIVALVAAAAWLSRTSDESSTNGDNRSASMHYGPGAHM